MQVGYGSGFVVDVLPDNSVIIATNRHVAVLDLSEFPPSIAKKGATASLEVVFRSGLGPQEQILPAEILAYHRTQEIATNLAFLVAKGVKNPPLPLNIMSTVEVTEGMHYIAAGFALGKLLNGFSESKGNPRRHHHHGHREPNPHR